MVLEAVAPMSSKEKTSLVPPGSRTTRLTQDPAGAAKPSSRRRDIDARRR